MLTNQFVTMKDIQISNGTLISMHGDHVEDMSYEVPKVNARISHEFGRRISLTFYQLKSTSTDMATNGKTPSFGGPINFHAFNQNQFFNLGSFNDANMLKMPM